MPDQGFVIQADEPDFEITLKVRWVAGGIPDLDRLQSALTNAYATAFAEAAKRIEASAS